MNKLLFLLCAFFLVSCTNQKKPPVLKETYTMTINNDNGELLKEVLYEKGTVITSMADPFKDGYDFKGYFIDDQKMEFPYTVTNNVLLIAHWEESEVVIPIYTLTLDLDIRYDKNPVGDYRLPTPEIEGYVFLGWYDNLEYTGDEYKWVTLTDDLSLFAHLAMDLEAYDEAMQALSSEVINDDIDLITEVFDFEVTYQSSSNTLSNTGKYLKPYEEEIIYMNATITDGIRVEEKTYTFIPKPYEALEDGNIKSGYIYRGLTAIPLETFETLDIINASFALANKDGNFTNLVYFTDVQKYIMPRAREHGVRVMLVVGPGTNWSGMVESGADAIRNFADNIIAEINRYGFNGVDIDWETPTAAEAPWFTFMMEHIYTKVKANNPHHLVTAAIAGGVYQPPRYNLPDSKQYLDYINMMTYDMSAVGGQYQGPLYRSTVFHNPTAKVGITGYSCSIDESVTIYNGYGIENRKIIVGIPFYGRVQKLENGAWVHPQQAIQYHTIVGYLKNRTYIEYYDTNAEAAYALSRDGNTFISYDTPRSVLAKAAYVKEKGLGGMMYWENYQDETGTLLNAIKEGLS